MIATVYYVMILILMILNHFDFKSIFGKIKNDF